jgi:hypothetical protein
MNQVRLIVVQILLIALLGSSARAQGTVPPGDRAESEELAVVSVDFFDVLEIPARIDGLRLESNGNTIRLTGAVANRSGEELLGLRLILLIFSSSGKLRSRLSWTERSLVAGYSIDKEVLQPTGLEHLNAGDRLVLGIDEVIGRETIWRATGIEKALRAYARGQLDVLPLVRTIPNKFDSRSLQLPVLPPVKPH